MKIMKKKKNKMKIRINKYVYILLGIFTVLLVILLYLSTSTEEKIVKSEMEKEGFFTEETDAFYRKIESKNDLDSFYKSMNNKENSEYEEYYLLKESFELSELKMKYKNEKNTTISISSNLNSEDISFNFEMSYEKKYLLIEGNKENNYECEPVVSKNISSSELHNYCSMITDEINNYVIKKNEIKRNNTIMNIVKTK